MATEYTQWSEQEFGHAVLGDRRRVERLVQLGARAAERPSGKLTNVLSDASEREAGYRFVENEAIAVSALVEAAQRACVGRMQGACYVYVPVDQTSLSVTDRDQSKGYGSVGSGHRKGRGVQVMSALGVSEEGVPLGLLGQRSWLRPARRKVGESRKQKRAKERRSVSEKETHQWLEVMHQASAACEPSGTIPWFVMDRGADAWTILAQGPALGARLTVRLSSRHRRVRSEEDRQEYAVSEAVRQSATLGSYELNVPSGPLRSARTARMQVHSVRVQLEPRDDHGHKRPGLQPLELWVVWAHEVSAVPQGEKPLDWMLWTNVSVDSMAQAVTIIESYVQRWRIEEFHKMWKTGACRVEDSQAHHGRTLMRWAVILASVAIRILRLSYLARTRPTQPASVELTQAEIQAVIVLRKPQGGHAQPNGPTIAQVTLWLAQLGGYTGKSSGGPPGPMVLARGLERIQSLALYFKENSKL